ncbi:MAG: hypothetical protein IJ660_06200 [Alphaproteobacteria bacterium]|nr:hypothetical protein [Alphaproteobacteria bacterium]
MNTKVFCIIVLMVACVNGMFAQAEFESQTQDSLPDIEVMRRAEKPTPKQDNLEEVALLLHKFHEYAQAENKLDASEINLLVPCQGKGWFGRHFNITQQVGLSISAGADKNEDIDDMGDYANNIDNDKQDHGSNLGFDVEYSRTYQPGKLIGDSLKLNRFGLAYSWGMLVSVDKQEKYGETSDILLKLGIETGKGHTMAVGADFLFGTGTSAVTLVFDRTTYGQTDSQTDSDYDYSMYDYDTRWCLKYGFQFWLKSKLLHTGIKNTDIKLFVRCVYSVDPTNDSDFLVGNKQTGYYLWSPESWCIGLKFSYEF